MKISLFFKEATFIKEFPDSNFLLSTVSVGGKYDFQVEICYLLLLISNSCIAKAKINFENEKV